MEVPHKGLYTSAYHGFLHWATEHRGGEESGTPGGEGAAQPGSDPTGCRKRGQREGSSQPAGSHLLPEPSLMLA